MSQKRQKVNNSDESDFYKTLKGSNPFFVFAGPCAIESEKHAFEMAQRVKEIGKNLDIEIVYKSSYDKANRTSVSSYRGLGIDEGLRILGEVKKRFDIPVITDVHTAEQATQAGAVADVLQIPAFLCRQTDLLVAAGRTGKVINVKKGQFASATTMVHAVEKVRASLDIGGGGNPNVCVCERGNTFGYGDLVVDMRNLVRMRGARCPVVQDVTHSVQQPGGLGNATGGLREFIPTIARAAVATGVDGLFFEVHDDPANALSDGPNSWPIQHFEELLIELKAIAAVTRGKEKFVNPLE